MSSEEKQLLKLPEQEVEKITEEDYNTRQLGGNFKRETPPMSHKFVNRSWEHQLFCGCAKSDMNEEYKFEHEQNLGVWSSGEVRLPDLCSPLLIFVTLAREQWSCILGNIGPGF